MFSWRARRQLVIFLIVIAPLVVAGFITIKNLIPEATCFDRKQNQNERGIDCGGLCTSCAFKYPKPITVFWTRVVPVRESSYDVAAEIENPNESLSSINVAYEFTLYDEFGSVVTKTGTTFIYPQERILVVESNIKSIRTANRVEFRITHVDWQERQDTQPSIIAERREYYVKEEHGKKQSMVDITLFNKSPYDFARLEMHVAVLDKEGNLLGVNKILVERLLSQSRQVVTSLWPGEFAGEVSVVNVQARVNIFDSRSILKPQ